MTAPYAISLAGHDQKVAELVRRFPGASVWLGESTGHWWVLARDGAGCYRLVEAASVAVLARHLDELGARQAVPGPRYSRARLAAGSSRLRPDSDHIGSADAVARRPPARSRNSRCRGWARSALSGFLTAIAFGESHA